jgi:hypothetical protein
VILLPDVYDPIYYLLTSKSLETWTKSLETWKKDVAEFLCILNKEIAKK